MTRVAIVAVLLLVGSALAPSCAAPGTPMAITYLGAWDADGATMHDDGTWSTTTDLGFDVRVLDATLTTYAVTLVPCDDTGASARVERVRRFFAPAVALAGHLDHPDASMIEPNLVETIAPGETSTLGSIAITTTATYCRAHQLIGGRVDLTTETPTRLPSLTLAVEVRDASGAEVRTMDLASTVATGTLADVPETTGGDVALTWTRPLARLFDGIAWDDSALTSASVAQSVLLTIAADSRVEMTPN